MKHANTMRAKAELLNVEMGFLYSFHTINKKVYSLISYSLDLRSAFEAHSTSDGQEILRI